LTAARAAGALAEDDSVKIPRVSNNKEEADSSTRARGNFRHEHSLEEDDTNDFTHNCPLIGAFSKEKLRQLRENRDCDRL